ncbi:alpha/beta fold hydrolase, partial [Actinomadura adrarensis]
SSAAQHSSSRTTAQRSDCLPEAIPGAECGTVTVPLIRSAPDQGRITVAYALLRHRDRSRPAKGTVVANPGGPGDSAMAMASAYAKLYAPLLADHDLLLVDPRGVNKSSPINCGLPSHVTSRQALLRAVEQCGRVLGANARGYTTAETADDIEAIRAELRIPKLDLLGQSYGTYLMAVYAQRHPGRVRSIVLSSAYPLDFDMWARPGVRAARRTIYILCDRSGGKCDGRQLEADLGRLATRLQRAPIRYTDDNGNGRLLDAQMLASVFQHAASEAAEHLGGFPDTVRAALEGDTEPLVATARALDPYRLSAPGIPFNAAQTMAVACNDYPVLWNAEAPLAERRRQF